MPSKTTKDVRRGDMFAINTAIGYAFFQVVGSQYEPGIYVIRVLQTVLPTVNDFQDTMACEKERYYAMMVVGEAVKRKLITYVGAYSLPRHARVPVKYRSLEYIPHKNIRNWYEVYVIGGAIQYRLVKKLTEKFLALSGHGIWNDTLLRERIEENWSLKDWK